MQARFIRIALCGALSVWPALVSAEQATAPPATPSVPQQPNTVATSPEAVDAALEHARVLFWKGHERYDAGQYAEAAQLFEESYAALPQAEVLFNIALARARSGRCHDAEQAFAQYSRAVDPSEATQLASQSFRDVLAQCSSAAAQTASGVDVLPESAASEAAHAPPPPTKPKLAAVVLPPLATDVADSPPSNYWSTQRIVGWSLLGAAAAATGFAFYFDNERRDAQEANQALTGASDHPPDAGDQSAALEEKYQHAQIGMGVATAAALGCAAVGAGLLIYSGDGVSSAAAQFVVNPAGARIGVSGHF